MNLLKSVMSRAHAKLAVSGLIYRGKSWETTQPVAHVAER
jgi:hypothetical protein